MQKIMFSDEFQLTKAVLEGRKTMTRRIAYIGDFQKPIAGFLTEGSVAGTLVLTDNWKAVAKSRYKVGEVVAVAQNYGAILDELEDPRNFSCMEHWESKSSDRGKYAELAMYSPGGENKMFVCADEMPHQIRITNVRVERLQDISDEDCMREGLIGDKQACLYGYRNRKHYETFFNPRDAFAALIDKISGKGTWNRNPWVFVYEFELIK